jgi:methionine biosynthesis protein MetW
MNRNPEFSGSVDKGELLTLLRLMNEKVDPALLDLLLEQGANFLGTVGSSDAPPEGNADWQYPVIAGAIPDAASILDLGCGEGRLLSWLAAAKNARVQGVELDADKVAACVERGIPVIQTDLDLGLKVFPDKAFDYVILEETLQTLRHPDVIISEMRRVGRRGIVTFPNFGFWRVRLDLAVRGRMPVTGWLPHRWFETPNIHLFSIRDFIDYAEEVGMKLLSIHVLEGGRSRLFEKGDNLYAEEALAIFE